MWAEPPPLVRPLWSHPQQAHLLLLNTRFWDTGQIFGCNGKILVPKRCVTIVIIHCFARKQGRSLESFGWDGCKRVFHSNLLNWMIPQILVLLNKIGPEAERCLTSTVGENVSSFPCRVLSQLRISKFWLESPSST